MNNMTACTCLLGAVAAFSATQAAAQMVPPYNVVVGWDASTETAVDESWKPHLNPLGGGQVWTWTGAEQPLLNSVADPDLMGITSAFESTGDVGATLTPPNPQALPLDPTNGAASIELWLQPSSLTGGPQVLTSFGNNWTGTSLTLDDDILRLQVRRTNVRSGIDLNEPPDGVFDDGMEDLVGVIQTRLTETERFLHIVAAIETGGAEPQLALYVDGVLAEPIDDTGTGLFKDETLVGLGSNFMSVPGSAGQNPLVTRTTTDGPVVTEIAIDDWSSSAEATLLRKISVVGGHVGPAGGDLSLARFRNTSFVGQIAIVNLYSRALDARQVAVLHSQAAQGSEIVPGASHQPGLLLNFDAAVGALSGGHDWENRQPVNLGSDFPSNALDWKFDRTDGSNLVRGEISAYPGIRAAYAFSRNTIDDNGALIAQRFDGTTANSISGILGGGLQRKDIAIEVWFKPESLAGRQVLFETGGTGTGTSIRINDGALEFAVRHGAVPDPTARGVLLSTSVSALGTDEFIQAVGVINLTEGLIRLYLNGNLESEAPFSGTAWDTADAAGLGGIKGRLGGGQGAGFGDFEGQIAIVRLYGRALSDEDVQESFESVAGSQDDESEIGLIGYWSFDEGDGSIAHDSSGNANHGTLMNAGWAPGRAGQALSLSGTNDSHVSIPASESLNNVGDALTVTAWAFPTAPIPDLHIVIAQRAVDGLNHPDQFYLGFGDQAGILAYKWHASTIVDMIERRSSIYTGQPTSGRWIHLAGTYDGEFIRLYLDGEQIGPSRPLIGNIPINNRNLIIGAEDQAATQTITGEFTGLIDEVRIYNRALSGAEIQELMNRR